MAAAHGKLGLIAVALATAAGCAASPPPPQAPEVPVIGCNMPFPFTEPNRGEVVEGFGGPDDQLIVTKRQPRQRCVATTVQALEARAGALR